MSQGYQYPPLDPKRRQIRLVTLESGAWSDKICCIIDVVSFDGHPIYEALSYVWGDEKDQEDIQLNDHPFKVTKNLWMVLRRLRDSAVSRVLWIDAICINQSDKNEKSHQVAMMGEIYSSCQKAIIWLGEDLDTTQAGSKSIVASRAYDMLKMLGADKHLDQLPCFSTSDGQRTEISEEYTIHFEAFRKFVDVPWWKRIWVIQEMVLPKSLKFLYSSEEFSYETLKSVVQGLQIHGTTCCKQYRYTLRALAFDPILTLQERVEPMVFTRETWTHQAPTTLFHLRRQFSASQASQKRDLFYALLGLVTSWGSSTTPLYPDYEISQKEAITRAVFKCISEQAGLEFLQGEKIFRGEEDMPSWIPDAHFTTVPSQWVIVEQRRLRISSGFSASASLRQDASKLTLAANGTLLCQTLKVDDIVDVGSVCQALERFEEAPDVFREWMQMVGIGMGDWPEQPPPGGSQADIFWKTMINDSAELDTSESPFYRRTNEDDYVQLRNLWLLLLSPLGGLLAPKLSLSLKSHDDLMSQAPSTIYHILVCLWHRRLFRTEKGWIGLAPENSCPGDEVHVLLGSPAPFILRRSDKSFRADGQTEAIPAYTVIGNAYLHEIMFGEAFKNDGEKSIKSIALY
jgi:Heterokaryon incompatibility protein (HET)